MHLFHFKKRNKCLIIISCFFQIKAQSLMIRINIMHLIIIIDKFINIDYILCIDNSFKNLCYTTSLQRSCNRIKNSSLNICDEITVTKWSYTKPVI